MFPDHDCRMLQTGTFCLLLASLAPAVASAQRDARLPAVAQGFDPAECRRDCTIDTLTIDIDRSRRAPPGTVTASIVMVDTLAVPRRGAPQQPGERLAAVVVSCDSAPCGGALLPGRITDRRIDDARLERRTVITWRLPVPLLLRMQRATMYGVSVDGRAHAMSAGNAAASRALIESVRTSFADAEYSPRAQLYVATLATLGTPGDSTLAEDVGTATEPLLIPDATTPPPTRVATLHLAGRGPDAVPLLVQDDATGAAPLFGVGETVTVLLPGRAGRRGTISGKIAARQRVESMRDACLGMKVWTYLLSLPPADMASIARRAIVSSRTAPGMDRWSGAAVRETVPARMLPAEQRQITGARGTVAQFVRERAAAGLQEGDVQVLAALPRGGGYVTNFGVVRRDGSGGWIFPPLTLRQAACK